MFEAIESIFYSIVQYGILLLEAMGVGTIIVTAILCVYRAIRGGKLVRLQLAQGIALALEFKLGGEVLRTVVVREWQELLILGAVIVLRAALTLLIHWEIKHEESRLK